MRISVFDPFHSPHNEARFKFILLDLKDSLDLNDQSLTKHRLAFVKAISMPSLPIHGSRVLSSEVGRHFPLHDHPVTIIK